MPSPGINKRLTQVEAHDEGVLLVPFSFTINGSSDPDGIVGDLIDTVARSEAGEFLVTLKRRPARCFFGSAGVSETADDTQLSARVDWSTVVSAGTFVVRTFGAATTTLTSGAVTGTLTSGALTGTVTDLTVDLAGAGAPNDPDTAALHAGAVTGTVTSGALTGTVTTLTGTTTGVQVDPTDNLIVGGFLLVSKTNRDGRP